MTTLGETRRRVALIIPRLASEHEGEVIATVFAINRILAADNQDFHALAEVVRGDSEPGPKVQVTTQDWRATVRAMRLHGYGVLTPWEWSFVENLTAMPTHWKRITPKQAAILAGIADRLRQRRRA